jgi:hypothetical protein
MTFMKGNNMTATTATTQIRETYKATSLINEALFIIKSVLFVAAITLATATVWL